LDQKVTKTTSISEILTLKEKILLSGVENLNIFCKNAKKGLETNTFLPNSPYETVVLKCLHKTSSLAS